MTGVWVFTQQIVQNRYNIRHITLTTPVYFLPSNLPRLCGHAITLCKGKVLTWPHSLIFALATCLIATFNPSLLLIPAYTIPKPPFPRTGPTQINTIIISAGIEGNVSSRTLYNFSNSSEAELASFLLVSMLVCLYRLGSSFSWLQSTSLYWVEVVNIASSTSPDPQMLPSFIDSSSVISLLRNHHCWKSPTSWKQTFQRIAETERRSR